FPELRSNGKSRRRNKEQKEKRCRRFQKSQCPESSIAVFHHSIIPLFQRCYCFVLLWSVLFRQDTHGKGSGSCQKIRNRAAIFRQSHSVHLLRASDGLGRRKHRVNGRRQSREKLPFHHKAWIGCVGLHVDPVIGTKTVENPDELIQAVRLIGF